MCDAQIRRARRARAAAKLLGQRHNRWVTALHDQQQPVVALRSARRRREPAGLVFFSKVSVHIAGTKQTRRCMASCDSQSKSRYAEQLLCMPCLCWLAGCAQGVRRVCTGCAQGVLHELRG